MPEPMEAPCRPTPTYPFRRAGQGTGQPTTAPLQRPSEPTPLPTAKPAATPVPAVAGATGPEGTLNTGFREVNPYAAHPSLSSTIQAQFVGSGIGETPVSQDVNDVFQTELFSDWEVAEDGLTWTFTVRKGVPFHKGYGEMTADDLDMLLRLARPNIGAITSKRQAEELGDEGCTASTYSGPSAPRSRTGANALSTERPPVPHRHRVQQAQVNRRGRHVSRSHGQNRLIPIPGQQGD